MPLASARYPPAAARCVSCDCGVPAVHPLLFLFPIRALPIGDKQTTHGPEKPRTRATPPLQQGHPYFDTAFCPIASADRVTFSYDEKMDGMTLTLSFKETKNYHFWEAERSATALNAPYWSYGRAKTVGTDMAGDFHYVSKPLSEECGGQPLHVYIAKDVYRDGFLRRGDLSEPRFFVRHISSWPAVLMGMGAFGAVPGRLCATTASGLRKNGWVLRDNCNLFESDGGLFTNPACDIRATHLQMESPQKKNATIKLLGFANGQDVELILVE